MALCPLCDRFRDNCTIRDREVFIELQSIDFQTLRAPEGDYDDRADACALAQVARVYDRSSANITVMVLDWRMSCRRFINVSPTAMVCRFADTVSGSWTRPNIPRPAWRGSSMYPHDVAAGDQTQLLADENR